MSDGTCAGRVCVVTGAGRGLGREYALDLARHGGLVVANDLGVTLDGAGYDRSAAADVVAEIESAGGSAVASTADISTWAGAEQLVEQAIATFGRLDVLINNAGIIRDRMIVTMSEQDWDDVVRVHLKGTFATTRHASAHWRERAKQGLANDARVINTTSASGLYANVGQSNYGAAKAGVASFTQIVAQEVERYGVTVNAVAPGALTRLTASLEMSEDRKATFGAEWVAPLVTWLASPLSASVTGEVFECSGRVLAVAEGWRRGPAVSDVPRSVEEVDAVARRLLAERRPRSTMADVATSANVGSARASSDSTAGSVPVTGR